jgi:DeoR/GlpR family transcriptional regulator of sugar metabolism
MTQRALRYDSAPTRREQILDLVRESGYYALAALSRDLGVSDMTVRRDVRKLAEQGLVNVVHGGVSAVTDLIAPVDFRFRSDQHTTAKRAIAIQTLALIPPGSVVGLDAGTTLVEVARRLPLDQRLTVVTHSLPAMAAVSRRPGIELIGLGGAFFREGQEFAGPLAHKLISQLRVETLLLGTAAVREGRLWSTNGPDVEMKQAMMKAADKVVLLVDSSKFAYSALMMVAELSAVTTVVTDELISDSARRVVVDAGVQLIVVPLGVQDGVFQIEDSLTADELRADKKGSTDGRVA